MVPSLEKETGVAQRTEGLGMRRACVRATPGEVGLMTDTRPRGPVTWGWG